ncbi:Oidioi.mRNA.OKI2018_I69.XSR.g13536.t1.cds [Oikopleura dioica]|uniref:Oidioi.mRNA.OKI2018_I69.XSR.g13536.t1.cds n=1 Tax=Oikopleura dioica TaxID=34765 RepID=A0ABN7SAV7_OIKDI|nr:Oidioi.mRNA.OKI2018_I69.XSR.g13536.t1.cds [Oikopleura dioica]
MKISLALIASSFGQDLATAGNSSATEAPVVSYTEAVSLLNDGSNNGTSAVLRNGETEECVKGAWGKDCFNNCNCGENGCDKNTGVCDGDVGVCPDHYTGPRCDEPVCNDFCAGPGSICVAPHRCVCAGHYTQGSYKLSDVKDASTGEPYTMYYCSSNRGDGLKGAFASLLILIVSISLCAFVQTNATGRDRRKQYEYIAETEQ